MIRLLPILGTVNNGPPKRINALEDLTDKVSDGLEGLGAFADANRALVSDGAPTDRHPAGFDPLARGGVS